MARVGLGRRVQEAEADTGAREAARCEVERYAAVGVREPGPKWDVMGVGQKAAVGGEGRYTRD